MDTTLAKAILNEAKSGEYYFKDFPETEAELISEAQYFVEEAEKAIEEGWGRKNETILAIANLAQAHPKDFTPNGNSWNGLPLPAEVTGHPSMPTDLTSLSDLKIRKLYGDFNACLASARWKLAEETANLTNATHLRDDAYRESFKQVTRIDPETDRAKSVAILELEAKDDPAYIDLDKKVVDHTIATTKLKALVEIYLGNVDRLSREMTFRDQEWQRTRA